MEYITGAYAMKNELLNGINKCVIYCRVSTLNQVTDGSGLETQESLCRQWAARNNMHVERVFSDAGKSGGKLDGRDALAGMVSVLERTKERHVVLFFDVKRLAREIVDFGLMRRRIENRGHLIATCQDGILDQSPQEHFITGINVLNGQLERELNAVRVKDFMLARALQGYWQFQLPWGLKFAGARKGKEVIADEPYASIIRQAFEGYANSKLEQITDVRDFVNKQRAALGMNPFTMTQTTDMLKNQMYTACFPYKKWEIETRVWAHVEPIVDMAIFQRVQDRILNRKRFHKNKYNKDNPVFPLKGYVVCGYCGRPLTASHSTGRHGKSYGYYQCQNKNCECRKDMYIQPQVIHKDFEALLARITPAKNDIALIRALARDIYNERMAEHNADYNEKERRVANIDHEIADLFANYQKAKSDAIRNLCEQNIERLTVEREALKSELNAPREQLMPFDQALDIVLAITGSPLAVWREADLSLRRVVLNIYFRGHLSYNKKEKFRTPEIAPIFKMLSEFQGSKSNMVPVVGLEPTTY